MSKQTNEQKIRRLEFQIEEIKERIKEAELNNNYLLVGLLKKSLLTRLKCIDYLRDKNMKEIISWKELMKKFNFNYQKW